MLYGTKHLKSHKAVPYLVVVLNKALEVQMKKALAQFTLPKFAVITVDEYIDQDIAKNTVIFFDEAYTMLKQA